MPENNSSKHVLIIGSGAGGLTCAIILLKLGYSVSVIEKNKEPGGLMRSYKRNGIDCPVGVHYIGSLDNKQPLKRMLDYLEVSRSIPVQRMGKNNIIDKYIFDDFTFDLPEGIDAYDVNLREQFPDEQNQITAIIKGLKEVAKITGSLHYLFNNNENFSIAEYFKPLGEILSNLGCSSDLRSVLEVPCSWMGVPLDECPVFYHHNILLSYLFSSWRLKNSGADMADVFAQKVRELGGNIILNDEVKNILVKNGKVTGTKLNSGRILHGSEIIAAVHPKIMIKILQEDSVKPAYKQRINMIKDTTGFFSVHLGLDASAHKELPYNIFEINRGTVSTGKFYQLRTSEKKNTNLLTILVPSKYSDWIKWENTQTGHRGDEYLEKKQTMANELIQNALKVFGNLKGLKIIDTYTPLTIRDWVNSPNGSAYGVLRSKQQLLKTALLNRTSLKGLSLAGQSVLAPGIFGTVLGSFNTVKNIVGHKLFKKNVLDIS